MEKHSENIGKWLQIVLAEEVGPATFGRLIEHFGSVEAILGANVSTLTKIRGIKDKTAEQICHGRDNFSAEKEISLADKQGVCIINISDDRYPALLKKLF